MIGIEVDVLLLVSQSTGCRTVLDVIFCVAVSSTSTFIPITRRCLLHGLSTPNSRLPSRGSCGAPIVAGATTSWASTTRPASCHRGNMPSPLPLPLSILPGYPRPTALQRPLTTSSKATRKQKRNSPGSGTLLSDRDNDDDVVGVFLAEQLTEEHALSRSRACFPQWRWWCGAVCGEIS